MGFVPDSKASPRLYAKHQRYARPGRLRYAAQKTAFITAQATRLSKTFAQIFDYLFANSAYEISVVSSATDLTADPFPSAKDSGEGGVGGP